MIQADNRPAAKRVGTTPEDHTRWLINLAYRYDAVTDFSTLPSEDVQLLFEELKAFLPDDPARPCTDASDDEGKPTPLSAEGLQTPLCRP
jgi:hypothetical protein